MPSVLQIRRSLLKAKNPVCWYCEQGFDPIELGLPAKGEPFAKKARRRAQATVEHLIPVSAGGPHSYQNCVLAHEWCNKTAGNLSGEEKIALREKLRLLGSAKFLKKRPLTLLTDQPCDEQEQTDGE